MGDVLNHLCFWVLTLVTNSMLADRFQPTTLGQRSGNHENAELR